MKNAYEIRGKVAAIILNSPKYGQMETLVDADDLPKADDFSGTWCAHWNKNMRGFYATGNTHTGRSRQIQLHRYLTDAPKGMVVDHINHDTLDNRRSSNLRVCTYSENGQNRNGADRSSRSGVRNCYWEERRQMWLVQVNRKHIGYYTHLWDAEAVAITARAKLLPYSTR